MSQDENPEQMLRFSVIDGFETSPGRIDENVGIRGALKPKRIDLRETQIGSVIQFYGIHPDSKYNCLLSGTEDERKIKIWLKGRGNGAIGSIDLMISQSFRESTLEKGVLELGKNYLLPTFWYDSKNNLALSDFMNYRTEPYRELFVLTPDHPQYRDVLEKNKRN